ncbi:MAG: flippase-like domain-containing protein [Acidimicrobiales bacterium]|nr:flippase-like domain-containing protein [Acidimicrobiales bacterium]
MRILRNGALLIILIPILEYFVIPRLTGASKSISILAKVNIFYLVLGVVLEAGALLAYALLTKSVLPKDSPRIGTLLRINMSTLSLSHVLPGGTAPGSALGYRLLTNRGVSATNATFCLATEGIGSALILNIILWISLIASIPFHSITNPLYGIAAVIGALLLGLLAALILLFTRGEEHAVGIINTIARKMPFISEEKLVAAIRNVAGRMDELAQDRHRMVHALVWACLNWLLDAASLWVFILAFGKLVSPLDLLVAYGVANVLAVIPITPGGLGVIEGILIPTLNGFGTPKNIAIIGVLAYRLVNFWIPIPVGGVTYLTLKFGKGTRVPATSGIGED